MAQASSVGGVGGEGKHGSRHRRQGNLPALTYLAGVVALLSLTMNLVMFYRSQAFHKSSSASSGVSPLSPAGMGKAAPEALLLSSSPVAVSGGDCDLFGGGRPHKDVVKGARLAVTDDKDHAKVSSGDVPQRITAAAAAADDEEDSVVINLDHGDPTMYEAFWRAVEEEGGFAIQSWQAMSYFSDSSSLCWFMEPKLAQEIARLHRLVGNARTDGWHILVGSGSTQLLQAALYALSPPVAAGPISVVSAAPYYSFYPAVTDYLQSRLYRWAGDAHVFDDANPYIEIVCSPNNPDGFLRQAVLDNKMGKTIHDLAYYWPQYTAITDEASHEIMLFTFSKLTGHAGTRIGWALVKDGDVAKKMTKFIELNTIGVSKESQLRAAQILGAISNNYEIPSPTQEERFFDYSRRLMTERWERLREAVRTTGSFSLPEFPFTNCKFMGGKSELHPAFAWMKCEKEAVGDCADFLKRHNILTRSGKHSGSSPRYVRVSMLDREEKFDLFIKRISSIK